jgi:hypothetical protein
MTAPIVDPAVDTPPTGDDNGPQDDAGKTFDADYVAKLRQESARYRTEAKANADAARKLAEIEAQQQKAEQTAAEREAAAEQRAAQAEARAMKLDVAFEKGLTPAQAKRLVGATREELEADADEILRDFPALKPDGRPKGNADLGGREKAPPANRQQADLQQIEADLAASRRK